MGELTYNPAVFDVPDIQSAREVILTPQAGQAPDERWQRETPYLAELLGTELGLRPGQLVVDYGCGIGRIAKALIEQFGCVVLGVDMSASMRSLAAEFVPAAAFSAVSRWTFDNLVRSGLKVDAAVSIWVLQHCIAPADDIELLRSALRTDGRLAVVNNVGRAVPSVEIGWADDGVDVRRLLSSRFATLRRGKLDPNIVGAVVSETTFWATYGVTPTGP